MNKRPIIYLFLGLLCISLTSCFDVLEEITLNKDGTGSVVYTLNLSQSKLKISQIMKLDTINDYPIPSEQQITDSILSYYNRSLKIKGLSNQKKSEDFENFIFTFSCDFTNIGALNDLAIGLNKAKKIDPNVSLEHYKFVKGENVYTRSGDYKIKKEFDKMKTIDQAVFKDAMFVSIFRGEAEILEAKNPETKVSPNKKNAMLALPIMDIVQGNSSVANTIYLKP